MFLNFFFKLIYFSVAFLIVALYLSRNRKYSSVETAHRISSYIPSQTLKLNERKNRYKQWEKDRYGLVYPYPKKRLQTSNREFIVDVGTFSPPLSITKISEWYFAPPPCLPETTLIIGDGLKNIYSLIREIL